MMFFFDTVQTFSSSGKTYKGQFLQEMARRLEYVLIQGYCLTEAVQFYEVPFVNS